MKNLTQLLALAMLVSFSSCEDEKPEDSGMDMGNLHISKSKPQPGDEILVTYSGDHSEKPEATINLINENNYYPVDLDLKDSADAWYGKMVIPDTIKAISFNFRKNDNYETNNDKGYVLTLHDENGKQLPGSKAIVGNYYMRYGKSFEIEMEKDSIIAMMEQDLKEYPELEDDFEIQYSNALMAKDPEKGNSYMDKRIELYHEKDTLSEENYNSLVELYSLKKDRKTSDSLTEIALSKYPKSNFARRDLMMKVVRAKEVDEQLEHLKTYEQQIGSSGFEYDMMLRYIANNFAEKKDWESFKEYVSKMSDPLSKAGIYNSIAWDKAEKGEDLEMAKELSKKSVDLISNTKPDGKHKPEYYSVSQFKRSLEYNMSLNADTYGLILYKLGNLDEAIAAQEKAVSDVSSGDVNTRYIQFLTENEEYEKAMNKSEEFIKANRASSEMEEYLQTAYSNTSEDKDFASYLANLKEEAKNNALAELEKSMLDEEAPAFALKDLEGNEIALNSLKGKTVILDFWATWCGPCKASFPGMQTAVEKYEDDPNVEFLFVDTFENIPNRKETVSNYIESENFSFHVLLDETINEESNSFKTAEDYGISGIPTKVIIGPDGRLNFKKVGYSGNNDQMVQEIGLMIELIKKNAKTQA